ncbi:MAG TPA: hypothetical protein VGA09_01895 [Candidatus Binatia bacterium]
MNELDIRLDDFRWLRNNAAGVGGIALAVCLVGAYFDKQQFFHSYLMAYFFWLGVPLGCFAIVMIHHLVGGTWGFVIQRPLESAIRTFPAMALLFVPLLFGLPELYLWARPEAVAHDALLQQKSVYLNLSFFIVRAVIYFVIWISVSFFLTRWSSEQDRSVDGSLVESLQHLSAPGLVLYGLTVTFSAIDWLMSLEPRWYSTIYGMIFMVSHGLMALSFVISTTYFLSRQGKFAQVAVPWVFQDLGNLLLSFIMLWAYLSFCQFLLVWVENLHQEIPWYLHRTAGGWAAVALALIILQFALPFVLLLSRAVKREAATLCGVAVLIILMHWVEILWFVAPAFHPTQFSISWLDVLASVAVGGLWLGAFLWNLQERSLLPFGDPRLIATVEEHGLVAKNG